MKLRIFICLWLIPGVQFAVAQGQNHRLVRNFTTDPALKGSGVSIYVSDLDGSRVLMSESAGQLLSPASTMKVITTAAALEILGPDYRFQTEFGFSGQTVRHENMLKGNLVVRGMGDPTLGSAAFGDSLAPEAIARHFTEALKKEGIVTVTGDLVIDVSAYDGYVAPGSWAWEDIGNYYGAGPSALTFADNMIHLWFNSPQKTGEPVDLIRTFPDLPWLSWQNELKSSSVNRDLAYVYGSPWGERRVIRGSIPAGRKAFEVKASMPEPPRYFGQFLLENLAGSGITLLGSLRVTDKKQEFTLLTTVWSPPLKEIITLINHKSVNLFTEHLVMQVAYEQSTRGRMEEGLQVISGFWEEKGIVEPLFMEDGSGLSRYNAVSSRFLVEVLKYMHGSKNGVLFRSTLPSAGNGTLGSFATADFPGETLRCKSGSLERVRGYAGYLKCQSGREVAFSILVNNFPGTSQEVVRKIRNLLLEIRKNY
ncbi:MAG: D-alanyl-D-alanine carboxypeptidase/D-alanyl-D-alanine-endopeptidase [Prolixibacteraceae bacterium]|nr:MAG: D-alanyl-D-alanine carboxypeptidase DacC precursor [Bacteroidetes bacterium ADurb.Bin123]